MNIKIPFTELEMNIAQIKLSNDEQRLEFLLNSLEKIAVEEGIAGDDFTIAKANQQAAAMHGISLEMLINSPNYSTFKDEYYSHTFRKIASRLMDCGATPEEAWVLLKAGLDAQ